MQLTGTSAHENTAPYFTRTALDCGAPACATATHLSVQLCYLPFLTAGDANFAFPFTRHCTPKHTRPNCGKGVDLMLRRSGSLHWTPHGHSMPQMLVDLVQRISHDASPDGAQLSSASHCCGKEKGKERRCRARCHLLEGVSVRGVEFGSEIKG
ncbi:hypothetical protein TRVL_06515 [Trypanosoma vivax]|nr:hypothetical protein TRVL_06515 [Trypanosoma vivax]